MTDTDRAIRDVRGRRGIALAAALTLTVVALSPAGAADAKRRSGEVVRSSAASWAVAQVGHRERGTTNCSPRINRWTKAMGLSRKPCPRWCGALVHQAFLQAGVRLSARLIDPDRSYEDAVAGRRGLKRIAVKSVRRGDLLFFAFRPRMKASHLSIVTSIPRAGYADTVEGNVAHAVRLKRRGLRYPVLAARVVVR